MSCQILSSEGHERSIEFWFEFASTYSYISVMRIEDLALEAGVPVVWRPFLLGPIFKSYGWDTTPFLLQKAKGDYMWRDVARQCAKYNVPWLQPTTFPRASLLPARVALVGAGEPWIGAFCREVMVRGFSRDQDTNAEPVIRNILEDLGACTSVLAAAHAEDTKQRLRQQTERAKTMGIFGAPTFVVRGEMFWGNDRLEDALTFASETAVQ